RIIVTIMNIQDSGLFSGEEADRLIESSRNLVDQITSSDAFSDAQDRAEEIGQEIQESGAWDSFVTALRNFFNSIVEFFRNLFCPVDVRLHLCMRSFFHLLPIFLFVITVPVTFTDAVLVDIDIINVKHRLFAGFQLIRVIFGYFEDNFTQADDRHNICYSHQSHEYVCSIPCKRNIHNSTDIDHNHNHQLKDKQYTRMFFYIVEIALSVEIIP